MACEKRPKPLPLLEQNNDAMGGVTVDQPGTAVAHEMVPVVLELLDWAEC